MASVAPNPKWREKMDITYEEFFKPYWGVPHQGLIDLVREMEKTIGKEKAHKILGRTAEKHWGSSVQPATEGTPEEIFQKWVQMNTPTSKLYTHALDFEVVELSPRSYTFNIRSCLWAKSFREMGAPDIGYLYCCKNDFPMTKAYHPNIELRRTKTLMQGDDCCDFCWTWEEDPK